MGGPAGGRAAGGARPVDLALEEGDPAWEAASALLQAGFLVGSRAGLSARAFMREALGLEDEYIEGVVSTVFIDSKPVDDIDAAILEEGSLIALSAAMPGLAGAVMRRRSPYASFREAISYPSRKAGPEGAPGTAGEALVRVKLFNSVMRDRGRDILARGVIVTAREAGRLLAGRPGTGEPAGPEELVLLRVASGKGMGP